MPIAPLAEPYASDPLLLRALCVWREARSEPLDAKLGVLRVIDNRCNLSPAQGFKKTPSQEILRPWQFTSFMEGDPNSTKYPLDTDPPADRQAWQESLEAARSVESDPTGGAVFYFSRPLTAPPHVWGNVKHSATLGNLQFYAIA